MNKKLTLVLFLAGAGFLFSQEKPTSFAFGAGTDFNQEFYFNFGFSVLKPLNGDKEFDLKTSLNLRTEDHEGEVLPQFILPVKVGLNFLFPTSDKMTFLAGAGLSPQLKMGNNETLFHVGPFLKGALRYKLHTTMSIFVEVSQTLLIGKPDWMYHSTEVTGGVNFYL